MSQIAFNQSADCEIVKAPTKNRQLPTYNENDLIVIYHANCYDGFCAAWLVHKVYPNATFIPMQYGNYFIKDISLEDTFRRKDVLVVDFSFPEEMCRELIPICKSFFICDHHKTAPINLGEDFIKFDNEKSGARLTQEYLGLESNWLIDYTEDRDLWRWLLPNSREVNAAIRNISFNAAEWDQTYSSRSIEEMAIIGSHIIKFEDTLISRAVQASVTLVEAAVWNIYFSKIDIVNSPIYQSEIANKLSVGKDFGIVYYVDEKVKKVIYSLRNIRQSDNSEIDLSEIAKAFGGGGHKNAAGFSVDYNLSHLYDLDNFKERLKNARLAERRFSGYLVDSTEADTGEKDT